MKKYGLLLFAIFLFIVGINVNAKNVTLEDMVEVINNGTITKEFLESKKSELDEETGKPKWEDVIVKAHIDEGMLYIDYEYITPEEAIGGGVETVIQEDGITLKSVIEYNEEDEYHYEREIELHNLIPLWEIEASDGWEKIQEYVESGYINKLNSIIDRCYRQEMHACRTSVSTYGQHEYISDVELNEEPANYVISKLKEEAKEEANEKLNARLLVIAIILILVILVLKLLQPKAKAIKY